MNQYSVQRPKKNSKLEILFVLITSLYAIRAMWEIKKIEINSFLPPFLDPSNGGRHALPFELLK